MTVAFHISEDPFEPYGVNFNFNIAIALAEKKPDDHFILIYDIPVLKKSLPKNCTVVHLTPSIKNNLSRYYWYNLKLPAVLNRYNVDIFIPHHGCYCSSCSVKQIITIHKEDAALKKNIFKATAVLQTIPVPDKYRQRVTSIPFGLQGSFKQLSFEEKEIIKSKYSQEQEYFFSRMIPADKQMMKMLLKSFSHFKKWQKSSLKLVILTDKNPIDDLHLYRFRDDVIILFEKNISVEEKASLIAASYGTVAYDNIAAIAAVKCATPAICITTSSDTFGNSMLCSLPDETSISKQMILLYKDEQLRNAVIHEAMHLADKYTWQNAADVLDNALEGCIQ